MESDTMIIEEEETKPAATEPVLEKRTQSLLCALKFHRRTRWSKPFSRKQVGSIFSVFGGRSQTEEHEYWFQIRECLGCGEREERSVS